MKLRVWLFFLAQSVLAVSTVRGGSHLNDIQRSSSSKVETSTQPITTQRTYLYACQRWVCLSQNLNLTQSSTKEQLSDNLKSVLPGIWHDRADRVVDACFGNNSKKISRMCSEQSFLHCVIQNLIDNCPEEYVRKNDACSKVTSFTSLRYLFSQSRYDNFETELPKDKRPEYFLRHYYNTKCCDLPELFTSDLKSKCGYSEFIHYYSHQWATTSHKDLVVTTPKNKQGTTPFIERTFDLNNNYDPLDCCDISEFIPSSLRADCDFRLSWGENGLVIRDPTFTTTLPPTTTTSRPFKRVDFKIVPLSCEKETCVFKKLNIMSESGDIDIDAFSKLLDSMTHSHSSWKKAKARVVTQCLRNPIKHYEGCEINKLLACTFDVLSENCPHAPKNDTCKHTSNMKEDIVCQISSSKYRPKHRRTFCDIPNLVHRNDHRVLAECGVNSINQIEYVFETINNVSKKTWMTKPGCKEMTDSSKCLLGKMDVLNKYGNIDYFGMKNRIREFTNGSAEWSKYGDVFAAAYTSTSLYKEQCYSPRRMLNVIDAMLMTCPATKRKVNNECNRFFANISNVRRNQHIINNMLVRM